MPGPRTPAAAPLGGVTSRRHAELLLHSGVGSAPVKDLRIHRVVPPAAGSLDSSPVCAAPVKPASVETTPPEAAAAEGLDPKPVLPRSKLVRRPGSFGYRRLLPFLTEMAKNDGSIGNEVLSENTVPHSKNELSRSDSRLVDGSLSESPCEPDAMDSIQPATVKNGGDTQVNDSCNNVTEEIKTVPHDLSNKPVLARCTRSRFVHHPSSFSYKRMLPFLMKNEISDQGSNKVKIRRVEERQLASNGVDDLSSGQQHLAVSDDSSQECNGAQVEMIEEEEPPKADENHVLDDRQLQPAVPEASPPDCGAVEVQNVMQQEALDSNQGLLASSECELTSDGDGVQAAEQHQLVVPEESPEECKSDEVKRSIQDEAVKSDGSYVLDSREFQPAVSDVSPEDSMAEAQKAAQGPLLLDGVEENSDKGDHLVKEQPVTKDALTEQLQAQDNAKFTEATQCQNSYSGCHGVNCDSPTKPVVHRHCAQEPQDTISSLDDQPLDDDIQMICRPSDPCAVSISLSVEEMSGSIPPSISGSSKAGILRPRGAHTMDQKVHSPRKLSPKKGILKRHTRGCKGVCMCLDCSTFRLHADRAFEFSRKQMQEADDIISSLLKEVANLRSLVEKPAGQRESTQAACKRASRVEEVARSRCQQMFVDLNAHCRIPGPRVRFAQYVEEKKASSSPRSSNRR
ncbi:hypothetical protein BS78_03G097500 [Paspalum vaginatum]|nr:hypothetical protein BS78_03G097500 [Paspalum vaginatum]